MNHYETKQERRARAALVRTLAREFHRSVKAAVANYVYSGSAYPHQVTEFRAITERIAKEYVGGDKA